MRATSDRSKSEAVNFFLNFVGDFSDKSSKRKKLSNGL